MTSRTRVLGACTLILAALSSFGCGDGTPPTTAGREPEASRQTVATGQVGTQLGRGTIGPFHIQSVFDGHRVELKSHDPSDILVNSASLAPGGSTGWHSHSGPVMVVVTSGAFTMYHGDDPACAPTVYSAGTAFIERGGLDDVHVGRNEGSVPVTWIATVILPVGAAGRLDAPASGNFPF